MSHTRFARALGAALALLLLGSCALVNTARQATGVFLREEDPLLAAETFPMLIKVSEALLAGDPANESYAVTTASLYVMYGAAFVQADAEFLPDSRYAERQEAVARAKALHERALRVLLPLLDKKAPGLVALLLKGEAPGPEGPAPLAPEAAKLLARLGPKDLGLLYWTSAAYLSRYALDALDLEGGKALLVAPQLLARAEAVQPGWNRGAVQEILVAFYAALPDYFGGGLDRAEAAFDKALSYSKGSSASLFVSKALSICVPRDDYPGFKENLELALAVDPAANPDGRLATELAKRRARKILATVQNYFILPEEGSN